MKLKSNYFGGVLLLFLLLASTSMVRADHAWGPYHWARQSNPFTLRLGDNVTSVWDGYLVQASNDWSVSSVLNTVIVPGTVNPRRCPITSGMVQVCNAAYGRTGWYGLARIVVTGDHITGGYAKFNDTYSMEPALKDLVTCQEVGHTFGLVHQDEVFTNRNLGTCMDYTNAAAGGVVNGFDYGPSNEQPNTHDYTMLDTIYAHLDSTTTVSNPMAVPSQIAQADFRSPRSWGRVMRVTREGIPDLFERDFGNGYKVLTHVFPVPGSRYEDEDHVE